MFRHLRAAAVLFHVVVISAIAIPAPSRVSEQQLGSDQGRAQIAAWAGAARGVGLSVSDEGFGQWVYETGNAWVDLRGDALRPLQPYLQLTGTRQAWRMFSIVSRRPTTLEIDVLKGMSWEQVYASGALGERWRAEQLDQERVRAFLSGHAGLERQGDYRRFVRRWVAPTLLADDPEAEAVRVRLRRAQALQAARVRAGEVSPEAFHWTLIIPREAP